MSIFATQYCSNTSMKMFQFFMIFLFVSAHCFFSHFQARKHVCKLKSKNKLIYQHVYKHYMDDKNVFNLVLRLKYIIILLSRVINRAI